MVSIRIPLFVNLIYYSRVLTILLRSVAGFSQIVHEASVTVEERDGPSFAKASLDLLLLQNLVLKR